MKYIVCKNTKINTNAGVKELKIGSYLAFGYGLKVTSMTKVILNGDTYILEPNDRFSIISSNALKIPERPKTREITSGNSARYSPGYAEKKKKPTPHEKCEKGTHWNEKSKKCEKVSEKLGKLQKTAKSYSKQADALPSYPKHREAYLAHNETANTLHKHGFKKLAQKHFNNASKHYIEMLKHLTK